MRTLSILSLALVVLLSSCKKDEDEPSFSSAEGDWTYTTPDGKISVDFTLVKSGTTWTATKQSITVAGTKGNAEIEVVGLNPPVIEYIRINANDPTLVYAFDIAFSNATVSDDFKEIRVPGATYTWPQNKANDLTNIIIVRK